jgi:2-methylisocitrate lyase-like PEP mutase family enzyme
LGDPFLIPNAWDIGSARVLEGIGCVALATTSSGFAFTLGRRDGGATLDDVVAHVRAVAAATSLPISVDLEDGHGATPTDVAEVIELVAQAGAVGSSIEDWDASGRPYSFDEAVARIAAAVEAARGLPFPFLLTARADNHLHGDPDLRDTIQRPRAFERVGADVLDAPGLGDLEDVRAVCRAVGRPVNVLALPSLGYLSDVFDAGARRVSVGGQLTWVAVETLVAAMDELRGEGDLNVLRTGLDVARWLV